MNYTPDSRDPHKLNGGGITAIHEDRAGTLWVGAWDGLYRYNRQNGTFTRYTENQGLPSSVIQGHSGRQSRQALAEHQEGDIPVRSADGNV